VVWIYDPVRESALKQVRGPGNRVKTSSIKDVLKVYVNAITVSYFSQLHGINKIPMTL
jgi:hypothetical protein